MGVAVDALIADLTRNRTAEGDQPIVADVDTFTAALQEIVSGAVSSSAQIISNGRLTLTTGVPVLSTDVVAAATLFFTPYNGNKVLIWNGSAFVSVTFTELSLDISALAANTVYDIFVSNSAAPTLSAVAWASATARASAISRVDGILANAANDTYVGTIATDATPACNMMFNPAGALGGSANRLDVWNMYNRVDVASTNIDSTTTWNYDELVYRPKNNNVNNGTIFAVGISEDALHAHNDAHAIVSATTTLGSTSIGLDSTDTPHAGASLVYDSPANGAFEISQSNLKLPAPIGRHFVCPLENGRAGAGTVGWQGTNTLTIAIKSAFYLSLRM